jgi:branched-chain amino acid transport system substrate-binding protein
MSKRLLLAVWVPIVLGAVFVLTCFTEAKEAYKVGAVFSVTGRGEFLGDPELKTVGMISEKVNKAGGINGHPLEVIVYDDKSDLEKSILAVKKLIEIDKVVAIIGPSLSGCSLAVIPIVEEAEIPLISCAASWKIVTKDRKTREQYKWVFKTPQSDSLAVKAIYAHMKKKGISKIAIMTGTTGFGVSGREELLRLASAYGIEIVADETYGPKDRNMTAQLTRIKDHAPQAIVNWSVGPTQVVVLRNSRDLGMAGIAFYQSHGFGSRQNIKLAKGAAEGVYCPLGACNTSRILPEDHPQKKVTMEYLNDYYNMYKEPLSSFGGHAWDALYLVIRALEAVGPDKAKIRDYLENQKGFVGQHGVFNFSAEDHNGLTREAFNMVVVKNGDWALSD